MSANDFPTHRESKPFRLSQECPFYDCIGPHRAEPAVHVRRARVAILIIGPLAALRTPTDIFPEIRIPVIGVVWNYTGLPPDEMAGRIVTPFQRALTTTVNDIEHIAANSYNGVGIVKIFFQPNVCLLYTS